MKVLSDSSARHSAVLLEAVSYVRVQGATAALRACRAPESPVVLQGGEYRHSDQMRSDHIHISSSRNRLIRRLDPEGSSCAWTHDIEGSMNS